MCNVHLIETSRTTRNVEDDGPRAAPCCCCYCGAAVQGEAVFIEGRLDDGSLGCYRFVYHPDCVWDMEHDLEEIDRNEGCFSDGTALEVIDVIDVTQRVEATLPSDGHPGLPGRAAPSTNPA